MADARVMDLDAHLMRLGRSNLDVFDSQRLAGGPGDRSLSDRVSVSLNHFPSDFPQVARMAGLLLMS